MIWPRLFAGRPGSICTKQTANHFSAALDSHGARFLMNPNMAHFSQISAGDLLSLSSAANEEPNGPDAPDRTAWELHSYLPPEYSACPVYPSHAYALCDGVELPRGSGNHSDLPEHRTVLWKCCL